MLWCVPYVLLVGLVTPVLVVQSVVDSEVELVLQLELLVQ
jgi:hypothetical protein